MPLQVPPPLLLLPTSNRYCCCLLATATVAAAATVAAGEVLATAANLSSHLVIKTFLEADVAIVVDNHGYVLKLDTSFISIDPALI